MSTPAPALNKVLLVVADHELVGWATNFNTANVEIDAALGKEVEQILGPDGSIKTVEEAVEVLEAGGYTVEIESRTYPREDKCQECGRHIGWVVSFMGELFALGWCDDHMSPDAEPELVIDESEGEGEDDGN